MKLKILCTLLIGIVLSETVVVAQENHEKIKLSFRDSLDHQLDLSDWIINAHGFVPVPVIITEPAVGGFGGGLAPVFIQPNKPVIKNGKAYPQPPDVTVGFGGYTLNNSWAAGGGRVGTIEKWGLRYMMIVGYGNINMDYYFDLERINQNAEFGFNIRTIPVTASLTKRLNDPRFSVGLQYLFTHNELDVKTDQSGPIIDQLNQKITDYMSGNVGWLGIKLAYDTRDNTFTPDQGIRTYITANWSNPVVGSDYKYGQFEGAFYYFLPLQYNLINGFRFDMQQSVGNQPFYIKPFIDMRGVPMARYQGKTTMLAELEERWDVSRRWSIVGFGGAGKGFDSFDQFGEKEWAWGYGAGFRYLMARKLKLRMGVDFAMGPEGFTYYLVFGSSWLRQ